METLNTASKVFYPSEIVVVDNDPRLLRATTEIIAKLGWRPQPFSKPNLALKYILEANHRVHTLVVELTTPGFISGFELALIVIEKAPEIRVIATSEILGSILQLSPEIQLISQPYSLQTLSVLLGSAR